MRISDWSSDVCSSDLRLRQSFDLLRTSSARRNLRSSTRRSGAPSCPLRTPAPRGLRHSLRRRSEEHTSELQSLMRISYAVFCLKKKSSTQQNWTKQIDN